MNVIMSLIKKNEINRRYFSLLKVVSARIISYMYMAHELKNHEMPCKNIDIIKN